MTHYVTHTPLSRSYLTQPVEQADIVERVWQMRYGKISTGILSAGYLLHCGCTAERRITDPTIETFTLPTLPPCKHGNTAYDVCCKITATNPAGTTTSYGPDEPVASQQ